MTHPPIDTRYQLQDRYTREQGRAYLTGVQALVRLPIMQRQRDRAAGLNTAGFISGYRGSPLGTYDMALWQARELLEAHQVRFQPGVNEDLAATSVWGSQQATLQPGANVDGVFGIWYGKGPGVDRSTDPIKHANYMGTSAHGGVLAYCGDDPGAKSSSIAHQSEQALIHCGIPILNPSSVQEYLDLGLYGWALSRYSGCWVGFKCLTDTVDSAASVEVGPERVQVVDPGFAFPEADHHISFNNVPLVIERQLYQVKLPAAQAFVRAHRLDRAVLDAPRRRLGIVTAGKATLDVRQALEELGVDEARAAELGLSVYKLAMTWPLEPEGALEFCRGLEHVIVVEEKRPVVEEQLARLLYNERERPRLTGKRDERGAPLVPAEGELAPASVAVALRGWLQHCVPEQAAKLRPPPETGGLAPPGQLTRLPSFCSGCPHSSSTVLPEDSIAMGGIGCHGMAVWLPERRTFGATHMGGEGANWIGQAPFTDMPHIFQNIGDGTYFHSGLLAIRACVAAEVNITFKVLVNGAVAMTGGQPIEGEPMEGEITCPEIAHQLAAEGVGRIAVVSNEPDKYGARAFPKGVSIHHRDRLITVQKELRETLGVTALVYDQTCAAEARRLRKRGEFPDPDRRIIINELVCEGCGDCSVQSNCISIEPVETEFGRKRRINQSSCNKDYSCVKGYCPSFVSVLGGRVRKASLDAVDTAGDRIFADLPEPQVAPTDAPWNVLVAGIGGTGVVTVGAVLSMAAHLEGKGVSELDVTGLAQKNGPVSSHVRIADRPEAIHATRIGIAGTDLLIGCDIVVSTNLENFPKLSPARTAAVVNSHVTPTAEFATNADLDLSSDAMERAVEAACRRDAIRFVDAAQLATALMGDAVYANVLLLGVAMQAGQLPVSGAALDRAIELNGRAVGENKRALAWGRLLVHDPDAVERAARPLARGAAAHAPAEKLEQVVARRVEFLTGYQSARYAARYRQLVERVAQREAQAAAGSDVLARAVARYYFKLLAIKDEYEIARLYTDGSFQAQLDREFEGDYKLRFHLASDHAATPLLAPLLARKDPESGRAAKWAMPDWFIMNLWRVMAPLKILRGTPLDFFGWRAHRRLERGLVAEYEATLEELLDGLVAENLDLAVQIASIPEMVRGFDLVKEQHLVQAREKQAELLQALRLRAGSGSADSGREVSA
jgi:indolepyruvate ferredoxin oxidoreductase